jgi:RNA polymerase sigma-54 factor
MTGLHVEQTLAVKKIGQKQEQSLRILHQDFLDLTSYLQEIEAENPFFDTERKKDVTDFKFVQYHSSRTSGFDISSAPALAETLHEHLMQQLGMMRLDPKTLRIAERLVTLIDSSGYLLIRTSEVADEFGGDEPAVVSVLQNVVQRLEPAGVGARDISECLLLQLSARQRADELLTEIIRYDLVLVAQNKLSAIAKKRGAGLDAVKRCCEALRRLTPKPGGSFGVGTIQYVFPDIVVEVREGCLGAWLTEEEIFSVSYNQAYAQRMMEAGDANARAFAESKARQAAWLCQCIRRRRETLKKIADHLVAAQPLFFEQGRGRLLPMTMKRMAEAIGVHESTVCRAASGKYVQCRWGVFPLKSFFSSSVGGMSAEALKTRIKEIIATEPKAKPLSDQRICDMLRAERKHLARRTVAKYREECRIPAASRRKQV